MTKESESPAHVKQFTSPDGRTTTVTKNDFSGLDDDGTPPLPVEHRIDPFSIGKVSVQWLTTGVNPSVRATGSDAGTRGWRLHAVEAGSDESIAAVRVRPAVCGLVPAHGWGLDLFVDRKCARCARALSLRASAVDAIDSERTAGR